jgi:hypothetical protein
LILITSLLNDPSKTHQKSQKNLKKQKKIKLVFSGFSLQLIEPNRTKTGRFESVSVLNCFLNGLVIFLDKNRTKLKMPTLTHSRLVLERERARGGEMRFHLYFVF